MSAQRAERIRAALAACAAALGDQALTFESYEHWRRSLPAPYSVPTALGIAGDPDTFVTVAADAGFHAELPPRRRHPTPTPPPVECGTPPSRAWDHSDMVAAVNQCAIDLDHTPTPADYQEWRDRQPDPHAVPPDAVIRAAGWAWIANRCRIWPTKRRTDTEIWANVAVARAHLEAPITKARYHSLRRNHPELRLVTADTIARRTGRTWTELFRT